MKIHHPGYGEPSGMYDRKSDFFFSDDIKKWMGGQKKMAKERDKERQKKNYYKRKGK